VPVLLLRTVHGPLSGRLGGGHGIRRAGRRPGQIRRCTVEWPEETRTQHSKPFGARVRWTSEQRRLRRERDVDSPPVINWRPGTTPEQRAQVEPLIMGRKRAVIDRLLDKVEARAGLLSAAQRERLAELARAGEA
jgi:hypothetical protein